MSLNNTTLRNNKGFIPNGDFIIQPEDRVVVFTQSDYIKKVEKYFY